MGVDSEKVSHAVNEIGNNANFADPQERGKKLSEAEWLLAG